MKKSKVKKKKYIISNISSNAGNVESMTINLAIGDVPKIRMKKKKMKRMSNKKWNVWRNKLPLWTERAY